MEKKATPASPGDGLANQGLAGAGRTDEEDAAGDAGAHASELLGVLEELDDFGELDLGLVDAGDVLEGDRGPIVGDLARLASAEVHRLVQAAARTTEEVDEQGAEEDEGQEGDEKPAEVEARALDGNLDAVRAGLDAGLAEYLVDGGARLFPRLELLAGGGENDELVALDLDGGDFAGLGHLDDLAELKFVGRTGRAQKEQQDDRDRGDHQDPSYGVRTNRRLQGSVPPMLGRRGAGPPVG